jgi:hypothetical protein
MRDVVLAALCPCSFLSCAIGAVNGLIIASLNGDFAVCCIQPFIWQCDYLVTLGLTRFAKMLRQIDG